MKKVNHIEIVEYTYETEEERLKHIEQMKKDGWNAMSREMRLKENVHVSKATEVDYEWYAEFRRVSK